MVIGRGSSRVIEGSIEELFDSINNSNEYKEYLSITEELNKNKEVINLIDEIKSLEKEATKLEYNGDSKYKDIDKIIEEKTTELNNNSTYKNYLSKLKNFNRVLLASSTLLEDYIDEKVSI